MKRTLAAAASTALSLGIGAALLVAAPPASAQQVTVGDESGDATGLALDLVSVTLSNHDKVVVAEMSFESTTEPSTLVVSADPRTGTGVRIVSEFKPRGTGKTRTYVLAKSLTDANPGTKRVRCKGVTHREGVDDASFYPTITLRMPSRCLDGGDYGALQFVVQVKRGTGRDWAPQQGPGAPIGWVARG